MGLINPTSKAKTSVISVAVALAAMGVHMPRAAACSASAAARSTPPVAANPAAIGKPSDIDEGKGESCVELRCDVWLQLQQKQVLLKLLKSYYAMSVDGKGGNPAEAELMSKLTARVVATK